MPAKDLSVLIPARQEQFLGKTIETVLACSEMDTEVIALLDGCWPDPPIQDHPKVTFIHYTEPIGQRAATNIAASISRAKYVMKLDAHCSVEQGFDRKLILDCEPDWTVIPREYNLHAFDWECTKCGKRYYQADPVEKCKCEGTDFRISMVWKPRMVREKMMDFACIDHTLHYQQWRRYPNRPEAQGDIADTMSFLGACWFMHRNRYWELEGLDEAHGFWGQVGQEVACKTWLSGGRLVVNKKTWYSHFFRVGKLKFPYQISGNAQERAREYARDLWFNNKWHKQIHPLSWLIEKFAPVKYWHDPIGMEALKRVTEAGEIFNKSMKAE